VRSTACCTKSTQPARYTGGELNSVVKDWDDPAIRTKVALAFPDIYELGGSNLGLHGALLADQRGAPICWPNASTVPGPISSTYMRRDAIPLYGLETRHPVADFDILGFSLPYEQLYTNVLTMLDLAGMPAARRRPHRRASAGHRRRLRPATTRSR
jgi:hypothetical protein